MASRLFSLGLFVQALSCLRAVAVDSVSSRQQGAAYSTFILPIDNDNLTFAINAVQSTGDVYLHFSAPATYSWFGVGTGSEMDGSVMWVVYESSHTNALTLSPRLSNGHVEPSYSKSVDCKIINGTNYEYRISGTSKTRYYSANVHCTNITALGNGEGMLDVTSAHQPFLYAFGPTNKPILSEDKTAGLRRHEIYGDFWMDMTKATSTDADDGAVPSGNALLTATNSGSDQGAERDSDKVGPAHAVPMLLAFVVIFPLGAVILRFLESVKFHGIVQGVGVLASVVGVGTGIYLSQMYNRSKNMSSGHQLFGLVLLVLVILQWSIGLYHHIIYRKHKRPTIFGKIHLYAGPAIVLGGIINGFTGFNFSGEPKDSIYYGVAVAIILVAVIALLAWKRWTKRSQEKRTTRGMERAAESNDNIGLNVMPGSYDQR